MLDEHEGAIDLPSTASAAPALTTLKPQQCRRLGPDHLAPAGQRSVMAACLRGQAIPPDPHAARRLQAMAARGERLHGMADLATMYRNRLLVMIGDSMSFQVTEAMRCAAASDLASTGAPVHGEHVPVSDAGGWAGTSLRLPRVGGQGLAGQLVRLVGQLARPGGHTWRFHGDGLLHAGLQFHVLVTNCDRL